MAQPLLALKNVTVIVNDFTRKIELISNVSFEIKELSIVALVGGSGSGKTTTGLSILRLLGPGLFVDSGSILLEGSDILKKSEDDMRSIRGSRIGMVFQEPLYAFNPVFTIGFQIDEVIKTHLGGNDRVRHRRVLDLLHIAGLDNPKRVAESYPHQLSGGMRQRAMIAQAVAADPKLIIADEPTSNLDVTLQAKMMDLFRKLKKELSLSILLISHDLGMVSHLSDYIVVMNKGKVAEQGEVSQIMHHSKEDYTKELMRVFQA